MFISHLRRVFRSSNLVLVRELRNRGHGPSPNPNPGMNKRIRAFENDGLPIKEDEIEEFIEESESDFSQVGFAYSDYMKESVMGKHALRHKIVKDKYFKENLPNLLTWSEKEQIRHLYNEDPDEWTPERLSQSFPVTVPVVKKLLKYPWKPASQERIARHDASAMRNWKDLKDGICDIPKELREHLLKFSTRTIPPLKKESIKIDLTQQKKMGEFESIVRKCAEQEESKDNNFTSTDESINKPHEKVRIDKKRLTLDELTTKIKQRIEDGKNVNMPDKIILSSTQSNVSSEPETMYAEIELPEKEEQNQVMKSEEDISSSKSVMEYPEHIRIPRKAFKKGATYKVNDCYYDYDGKFLYRVLGM